MKKIKNIVIVLLAAACFSACKADDKKHIGEWKATENGQVVSLILDKANHFTFVSGNEVIGGDNMDMGGRKVECTYEIDYTKSPMWLDLVFTDKANKEKHRWNGIVRFITDKKIELRTNHMFDGARYDRFDGDDKSSTIVMDKAE